MDNHPRSQESNTFRVDQACRKDQKKQELAMIVLSQYDKKKRTRWNQMESKPLLHAVLARNVDSMPSIISSGGTGADI
jgi:hypothetical protein